MIVVFSVFSRKPKDINVETEIVSKRDITEIISELGIVEAKNHSGLSFGSAGVIEEILVKEGDFVEKGEVLARLSAPALGFRVEEARARLTAEEARLSELVSGLSPAEQKVAAQTLKNAELSLASAERSQKLAREEALLQVENARRALFSSNLVPYLKDGERYGTQYAFTPPTISGTYEGTEEGEYEIELYPSFAESEYSFRFYGLETGRGSVSTIKAEPLGQKGLYITFPENFARDSNLKWIVEIPNKRSPNYASLSSAYESAKLALENLEKRAKQNLSEAESALELARAQNDLKLSGASAQTIAAQSAAVAAARAGLGQAESAYSDGIIRAPFSGIIVNTALKTGARVSPNQEIINLVSQNENQIVVYIPEADIAQLDVGDSASVQFDAFRDEKFSGEVVFVSPVATSERGVAQFKVVIQLDKNNPNIRAGITADVDIYAEEKKDVIAIPARAVVRQGENIFVRVRDENGFREVPVQTGMRSTDGFIEIVSGLKVGEEIITYISPTELTRLENLKNN